MAMTINAKALTTQPFDQMTLKNASRAKVLAAVRGTVFEPIIRAVYDQGLRLARIYPNTLHDFSRDDPMRNADLVVIDDGGGTHKQFGTTMGPKSFSHKGTKRLIRRAKAVFVNASDDPPEVGAMAVDLVAKRGFTILIETEAEAWADWARLVRDYKPADCFSVCRKPPGVIPNDLASFVNFEMEAATQTKH